MPKSIDHDRIAVMARSGCPIEIIARRLRCSERTVERVLTDAAITPDVNPLIGTDDEWRIWEVYRGYREHPARIAYRFGYTRQHMHEYFSQPRVVEGEPA